MVAVLLKLVSLVFGAPIIVPIIAEGERRLMPALAQKLYTLPLPFVNHMKDYEGWAKLDLAFGLSVLLFFTVFWLWLNILRQIAYPEKARGSEAFQSLVMGIGIVVVCADAILFYYALSQRSGIFGGGAFSFGALVMTIVYVGIVLAFSLGAVHLEEKQEPTP
jgi:hypothetical protein